MHVMNGWRISGGTNQEVMKDIRLDINFFLKTDVVNLTLENSHPSVHGFAILFLSSFFLVYNEYWDIPGTLFSRVS